MTRHFNVLLADDDPDDHQFFREALRNLKINGQNASEIVNVTSVYNGVQAIDFLLKRSVYQNRQEADPDFIVLDLNMPIKDGFTALREIRATGHLKEMPVYILTTSRDDRDKKLSAELQCAGSFSKPPRVEELAKAIATMFNADTELTK